MKQIIINSNGSESRVAILKEAKLERLFVERHNNRSIFGNIYLGKVQRIVSGIQAAFVDIGLDKAAFLYVSDIVNPDITGKLADEDIDDLEKVKARSHAPIESLLKAGQDVLVQVAKESLGSKGARLTMFISLPGRFAVLAPYFNHVGISRKIENDHERQRLKQIARDIGVKNAGIIVRTAAENVPSKTLIKDIKYLKDIWDDVQKKMRSKQSPFLVEESPSLAKQITRDYFSDEIDRIIIDDKKLYQEVRSFLKATIPGAEEKLIHFDDDNHLIFDTFGIEKDINEILGKKVELPSGGYLIVEQTEALTTIDVNTGSMTKGKNHQETIFKANKEAVVQIVRQILLRNIGGIIVLDFIDMTMEDHKTAINTMLESEMAPYKHKYQIYEINDLGLAHITRKRTSESLEDQLMVACPVCDGYGKVKSIQTLAYDLFRGLERFLQVQQNCHKLSIELREDVWNQIRYEEQNILKNMKKRYKVKIDFKPVISPTDVLKDKFYRISIEG